jgi:hypothetical protein
MPKKYQKEDFDFYRTKEELLEYSPDIANMECVICLLPIFIDEIPNENKNEKEKEDNNSVSVNTSRSGIQMTPNEFMKDNNNNFEMNVIKQKKNIKENKKEVNHKKSCKNCYGFYYIIDILLIKGFCCFYKLSKNSEKKIYMKTPCNHVFHATCLEKWLIRKKECPNCRYNLSDKIS